MSIENFMFILAGISIVTGLIVEAIKSFYNTDAYNIIAGVVALVLSVAVAVAWHFWFNTGIDARYIIFWLAMALASWLSAMLGFDKIKQAIQQIGA